MDLNHLMKVGTLLFEISSRIAITNIVDKIKLKFKRLFYPQVTEV